MKANGKDLASGAGQNAMSQKWFSMFPPGKLNAMKSKACRIVSALVIAISGFAGIYLCSPPLLRIFGLSDHARGIAAVPVLSIFIFGVAGVGLVGLFLFPVVLRPFLSASEFWTWIQSEKQVKIPILDCAFQGWARLIFGPNNEGNSQKKSAT